MDFRESLRKVYEEKWRISCETKIWVRRLPQWTQADVVKGDVVGWTAEIRVLASIRWVQNAVLCCRVGYQSTAMTGYRRVGELMKWVLAYAVSLWDWEIDWGVEAQLFSRGAVCTVLYLSTTTYILSNMSNCFGWVEDRLKSSGEREPESEMNEISTVQESKLLGGDAGGDGWWLEVEVFRVFGSSRGDEYHLYIWTYMAYRRPFDTHPTNQLASTLSFGTADRPPTLMNTGDSTWGYKWTISITGWRL